MDFALRPTRGDELLWCELDDGGVVTDLVDGQSWALNPVGLFVWDQCDGDRDIEQIVSAIQNCFGVDEHTAQDDLEVFLTSMEHRGLLELKRPPLAGPTDDQK